MLLAGLVAGDGGGNRTVSMVRHGRDLILLTPPGGTVRVNGRDLEADHGALVRSWFMLRINNGTDWDAMARRVGGAHGGRSWPRVLVGIPLACVRAGLRVPPAISTPHLLLAPLRE